MSKAKIIVGTLISALAISAFGSASASAITSSWMVAGTQLSGSAPLATKGKTLENVKLKFSGVTVECKGENLEAVAPQIEGVNTGSASELEFTGCAATGKNCSLAKSMKEKVGTLAVTGEATLEGAGEKVEVKFLPKTGTLFATLNFEGASCSIAEEVAPVKGKVKAEAPTGRTESVEQSLRLVTTEASTELKVGTSDASLEGAYMLKLSSAAAWSLL